MKHSIKSLLAALILCLSLSAPAMAGSFIDGLVKAAEQGDANIQVQLGAMYLLGQGVPQDSVKALGWYSKAAEQGHANAQYDLGLFYSEGKGVPQNNVEAYKWFTLAAGNGVLMAKQFRKDITPKMTPAQIAKAQRLAREWKPKK
jgi:TPR repeat protein